MGGITLPDGYTLRSYTTYSNNQTVKDRLKNGKDLVTVKAIDSRGNISSLVKELGVSFYAPPYFPEIEAVRVNDIDTQTRLKGTGKKIADDSISYIKYTSSTQPWTNGSTSGTTYGPFYIASSEITYNSNNTEFYLNSLIQGNLGASGFTKGNKYYLKIEIATGLNESFPMTTYTEVITGKTLMSFADDGVAFGGDYDENLGEALQIYGEIITPNSISSTSKITKYRGMVSDFDTTYIQGEYTYDLSSLHKPDQNDSSCGYGKLFVDVSDNSIHNNSTNWIWQTAYDTNGKIYRRQKINANSWTSWKVIPLINSPTQLSSNSNIFYRKINNVVYVHIEKYAMDFTFNSGATLDLGILPVGCRPAYITYGVIPGIQYGGKQYNYFFIINTNGVVQVNNRTGENVYTYGFNGDFSFDVTPLT